jgi:hypothetical protein
MNFTMKCKHCTNFLKNGGYCQGKLLRHSTRYMKLNQRCFACVHDSSPPRYHKSTSGHKWTKGP